MREGEPAKSVTWPSAGPGGVSLRSDDQATLHAYVAAKPGFVTKIEDGRIWVFREGSEELAQFEQAGDLAKYTIRPSAGPRGMTIKSSDAETINAYLAAQEGFET